MPYVTEDNLTDVALDAGRIFPIRACARSCSPDQACRTASCATSSRPRRNGRSPSTGSPAPARLLGKAPGIHPAPRTCSASACWSTRSIIGGRAERRPARSKARSTSPTRRRSPTGAIWPRARPASPASSPAPCAGSAANRSEGRCSTSGRPTARDSTRTSARSTTVDARPLPQPAGRVLRHPNRGADRLYHSHGRDRGRADGAHQYQPHAARAHPLRHHRARLDTCVTHLFSRATNSSRPTSSMA